MTLTKLPLPPNTMVVSPSTIDDADSPIMSVETIGSSVYDMIPLRLVLEESFSAKFTSSLVTSLFNVNTISTIEPLLTGTLSAMPSNFPLNLGKTEPIALAAPGTSWYY